MRAHSLEEFVEFIQNNVEITFTVPESELESPCWLWIGFVDKDGYGKTSFLGKNQRAHRISYRAFIGEIPAGKQVQHICNTTGCVSPFHLEIGTSQKNSDYMVQCGRSTARGRHWNHKLTEVEIAEIRSLHSGGVSQNALGRQFGVWPRTINRIVNNTSWKEG